MQLSNTKNISCSLAAATCALLGSPVQAQEQAWELDTALLYYGETDRVQLLEGVFAAKKDFGEEHIFSGKLVLDTLTGASASGAVAQPDVQTFTRPSGVGQYTVAAGETPLDDTFRDTRVQANAQWTQPLGKDLRGSFGGQVSNEYDYFSLSVNASLAYDFNLKNTTTSIGFNYANDEIDAVGGRPVPLASMAINTNYQEGSSELPPDFKPAFDATRQAGTDNKDTLDVLFGLTQVINRRMITQLNYSYSQSDGYHNDPYKVVSLVDAQGITQDLRYESRPDKRTKHSFYGQAKYAFDNATLDASYRFATDDWEIDSHTIESRLRYHLSDASYIEPHVRYYQQSAADFYQPFLTADTLPVEFVSADYRIGEMTAITLGLKYAMQLNNGNELAFRVEYYQQDPENPGITQIGALQGLDLFPSVKAIITQVSYSF